MPRTAANPTLDIHAALKAAAVQLKEAAKKDAKIVKLEEQLAKFKAGATAAPAAKRGRPAKATLAEVPVSKRVKSADVAAPKRGRAAKAEAAVAPAADAPKRRGRPPKAAAAPAPAAKPAKGAAKAAVKAAPAKRAAKDDGDDYLL